MASSQDSGAAGVHAIGATLALSNDVPQGIAAIRQNQVSFDRVMAAGAVGLETLLQLAEGLRTLGTQPMLPLAAIAEASPAETLPTADARPEVLSGSSGNRTYSQSPHDLLSARIQTQTEPASQLPQITTIPEQAHPIPEPSHTLNAVTSWTSTPQKHWSTAPAMPVTDVSAAQIAPAQLLDTAASTDAAAPVGRLPPMLTPLTAARAAAAPNTEFAETILAPTTAVTTAIGPTAIAPMIIAPDKLRTKDLTAINPSLTLETVIADAISHTSLTTGPSAPATATLSAQMASVAPLVTRQNAALQDGDVLTHAQRPHPTPRQPPDTTEEPRQGVLILDGAQLGRWIMDRIARQASRPTAGTTGIDPRVSPTFPGAPASV